MPSHWVSIGWLLLWNAPLSPLSQLPTNSLDSYIILHQVKTNNKHPLRWSFWGCYRLKCKSTSRHTHLQTPHNTYHTFNAHTVFFLYLYFSVYRTQSNCSNKWKRKQEIQCLCTDSAGKNKWCLSTHSWTMKQNHQSQLKRPWWKVNRE